MDIVVLLKQVPDLVEELEVDAGGASLDRSFLRFTLNECDDHALEQALLLKERIGARVSVIALDGDGVEDVLFTALAKGADAAVKVTGCDEGPSSHAAAAVLDPIVRARPHDLVLTGVQAIDDLDGQLGPILATRLGLPYVGVVSGVELDESRGGAVVKKEHSGGILSELSVKLPALLGIQAAERPPRYVPVARIRQVMKTARIEEAPAAEAVPAGPPGLTVRRFYKPETAGHAEMISGSAEEVASRLAGILAGKGLLR